MDEFGRYRPHANALMQISRKFRELSEIDRTNAALLEQCAASLTVIAEALVANSRDADGWRAAVLH